jgi:hypothetical protein
MFALGACSEKGPDEHAAAASGEPQHVWNEQVKALDKAKQLEQNMNEAYKKKAEEIDQQAR